MLKNCRVISLDGAVVHVMLSALAVLLATLALLLVWPSEVAAQRAYAREAGLATIAAASPLDSIARLAISRNLAVRQAREVERQGQLGVRQAKGLFLPTLSVDARYSEMTGALDIGDAINPAYAALNQLIGSNQFPTNIHQTLPYKQETKLRSALPLFNGALFANLAAARAIRDLRGAELAAAKRRLDADARVAYLNYARAVRAVDIYDAALRVVHENQRVAERLVGAGSATGDAVYRARATVADVQQQRAEAARLRDAALGALNLLLDRDATTPVAMLDDAQLPEQRPFTLDEALAAAQRREERTQVAAGTAAARAQGRAATSGFLPVLAVAADYGVQGSEYHFDTNHDAGMASVVLQWNLFNGGQDAMRRQQASSAQRTMALRAAEADRMIALDVRTAFDAVDVARQGLTAATARVEAARRAFQMVDRRFGEGLAQHLEWADARQQFTAAELNLVLSRFSLAARYVELERAAALRAIP
ncbi:MAG: TolC family protein [Gemmatimonadaceae bacterium]|nr:TolC family protein [Gemmatimonadaceae bacterium]